MNSKQLSKAKKAGSFSALGSSSAQDDTVAAVATLDLSAAVAGDELVGDGDDDDLAPVAFVASNANMAGREKKKRERRRIEKEIEKLEADLFGGKVHDVDSEAECDDALLGRR